MPRRIDPTLLTACTFSPNEVERLRLLYGRLYGVELTAEQAIRYGRALITYVALACRMVKSPEGSDDLDESATELN